MVVKNTAVYKMGCSKKLSNIPPLKMMSGMIANSHTLSISSPPPDYSRTACGVTP
jgi:hypothetical protein